MAIMFTTARKGPRHDTPIHQAGRRAGTLWEAGTDRQIDVRDTLLARRVDVMTLARISRHKDLRILLNTYYRESAEDIAARLK